MYFILLQSGKIHHSSADNHLGATLLYGARKQRKHGMGARKQRKHGIGARKQRKHGVAEVDSPHPPPPDACSPLCQDGDLY